MICCYQVTKIFCTRCGCANASSARGPCNFGPLTDLAISVFREVSLNTVFTQIRTSRRRRLHEIFSEFLQPFRYVRTQRVSPFYIVVFVFIWFLDFWLAWVTTGLTVLFVQHVNLTHALDGNLSHADLPFLESHCRLTQLWLVKWTSLRKI